MKTIRKMISVLLVATIFLASVSFLGVLSPVAALTQYSVSDIDAKFEELRLLYPQGAGWNRNNGTDEYGASKAGSEKCACSSSCVANCSCACGHYNGAYQCAGFAKIVSKRLFGYDCGARQTQYYDISIGSSVNIDAIVPGDIIRYRYSSGSAYDHSIVVIRVTTDRIYYVDCNGGGGGCRINWERSYTKSELKTRLGYKLVDGSVYAYGYVMHYKGNNYSNEVTYTHTFNFDSNGGSGSMGSVNVVSGGTLVIPECAFAREGYTFIGWNVKRTNDNAWYVRNQGWLTEEQILSDGFEKRMYSVGDTYNIDDSWTNGITGNCQYTFVAVWQEDPTYDETISNVMLRSIGQKTYYYVGDSLVTDGVSLVVENVDGTHEIVNDGFTCSPNTLSSEGVQTVAVNYKGHIVTYDVCVTKSKSRAVNATAKSASTGYLLPNKSSATIANQGSYANDTLQVLCKDGDFYLAFVPWGASAVNAANGVLLYLPVSSVTLSSSVPSAEEYYSMSPDGIKSGWLVNNTYIYHRPDGGASSVKYGDVSYTTMGPIEAGTAVRVLFEMNGYYCIQTDKYTGFVNKFDISLFPRGAGFTKDVDAATIEVGEILEDGFDVWFDNTDGTSECLTDEYSISVLDTSVAGTYYTVISYDNFYTIVEVNVIEKTYQPGDINSDGSVNMFDYVSLKSHYFEKTLLEGEALERADCNKDGKVNMLDYLFIKQVYYSA